MPYKYVLLTETRKPDIRPLVTHLRVINLLDVVELAMEAVNIGASTTFNNNILVEEARAELTELLESIRNDKYLVWEAQLGEYLNQILLGGAGSTAKIFKDNSVIKVKELKGEHDVLDMPASQPDVVYIVRPDLRLMKTIARQVKSVVESK
jgi:pyruvate dehydrogenase complex dehydrogenase (E1) component